MLVRHTLAAAVLAALAGIATAQDVRREDRRQDPPQREVEVELPLPRNANGALDRAALEREIRARVAAGATEIQFRDRGLTEAEARQLLLNDRSLLADVAQLLPNDGVERHVRFRGAVDARVQRNEDGELRARIEGINIGSMTAAQRAELARRLAAQSGFERVRIRGTDENGQRVRIELREGRGITRNEARGERVERADRQDRSGPGSGRQAGVERQERPERIERVARAERPERAERQERLERVERAERVERPDRSGRH